MAIEIYHGDCLELMPEIPDKTIDCVICDLPYGQTPLKWDNAIDFNKLWKEYERIVKDDGAILLFAQEPFATMLRNSNMKYYKYDWYWEKERITNIFQVNKRPGKTIENICVFYKKNGTYNPQKQVYTGTPVTNKIGKNAKLPVAIAGEKVKTRPTAYKDDGTRYPTQVLRINRDNPRKTVHPTQKPVELLEYLVNTYTLSGDIVLDNCMGSGSTGVACKHLGRSFIGIEKEGKYFEIAKARISNE